MNGVLPRATTGSPAFAGGAGFHRDDGAHLLLEDERIVGSDGAIRTTTVIGDGEIDLPAQDAALGVDLGRSELRCLHDRGRHDAIGAGQAYRYADFDRRFGRLADRNACQKGQQR